MMDVTLHLASLWDSLPKLYQVSVVASVVIYMTYILHAVTSDKIVIYFNDEDYILNLVMVTSLAVAILLLTNAEPFHSPVLNLLYHYVLIGGIFILGLVLFVISSIASYTHNKNVLIGILVTLFKFLYAMLSTIGVLLMVVMAIVSVFSAIEKLEERDYFHAAWNTLGIFVLIEAIYLIFKFGTETLINGDRVYDKREWNI